MVTAGVYLLIRASPLIEYSSTVLIVCLWIGSITTVFSSLVGLFQQDIKKVIAYSTMSQLGMMVIAVGLSSYNVALFHLVNHAFYKGLLFLGAGAVIHAVADNQDFRKYGGLVAFLPLTYSVMLIASLSLVAFPFMTGFYSKDLILESAYGQFHFSSIVVYFIATIGAMFTTLYSVKVLYLTFLTNANGPLTNYKNAHEGDIFMSLPLIILAVFSIFFGYISRDIFIGLASAFFSDNSLFIHPLHEIMLDTEFAVPTLFKLLPLLLTILFTGFSLILPEFTPKTLIYFKFSRLGYNITRFIFKLGGQTVKSLDKGSVELLGPYGLEIGLVKLSISLSKLDSGVITTYALYILIGLISYLLMPYVYSIDMSILILVIFALITVLWQGYSWAFSLNIMYRIFRGIVKFIGLCIIYWLLFFCLDKGLGLDMITTLDAEEPPLNEYGELGKHLDELWHSEKAKHVEQYKHLFGDHRPEFRFMLKERWFNPEQKETFIEFARNNPNESCLKHLNNALKNDDKVELYRTKLALKTIDKIKKYE